MTDVFDPEKRSAVMRAVKSRDTGPELKVRRAAHALGLRFRLGRSDLPGKPDLVFPRRRTALFVHGCFWHGHDCPRGARVPAANRAYWQAKIARNVARDAATLTALRELGWKPAVIWECETKDAQTLARLITLHIGKPPEA
jgi:DNA mismatch endonuclease, patch repair protein